jgi:hypothetical protein
MEGSGRADDEARNTVSANDLVGGCGRAHSTGAQLRALGSGRDHEVDALRVLRVRSGPDLETV